MKSLIWVSVMELHTVSIFYFKLLVLHLQVAIQYLYFVQNCLSVHYFSFNPRYIFSKQYYSYSRHLLSTWIINYCTVYCVYQVFMLYIIEISVCTVLAETNKDVVFTISKASVLISRLLQIKLSAPLYFTELLPSIASPPPLVVIKWKCILQQQSSEVNLEGLHGTLR